MCFLLRVAFWLSVVVLLLPTGPSPQIASAPQVGVSEALSAAIAAVSDTRQFCARQAEACAVGSQAIVQFGHKAQAAAKMLYEFLNERFAADHAGVRLKSEKPARNPSQDTLTPADLAAPWLGPQPAARVLQSS